jgi:hypothetical protein
MPIIIQFGTASGHGKQATHGHVQGIRMRTAAHCCLPVLSCLALSCLFLSACLLPGHDKIAAAAYRLIPPATLSSLHCHMAAQLLSSWDADEQEVRTHQQRERASQ